MFHIMFELLKNSCRAVTEFHADAEMLPPVTVYVVRGGDDLTVKVTDRGGGVPHADKGKLFNYLYSTYERPVLG